MTVGQFKLLLQNIDDNARMEVIFAINGHIEGYEPFLLKTPDNYVMITPAFLANEYIKREQDEAKEL